MRKIIDFDRFELLWEWLTGIRITEYINRLLCVSVSDFIFILFHCTELLEWPKGSEAILKTYLGNSLQAGVKSILSKLERLWRFYLNKCTKCEYLFEPI